MRFEDVLTIIGNEPLFDTGLLLAGDMNPNYLRRQLAEWVKTGKIWQLRRGLYALAPPHQKVNPHPFLVANRLVSGSYISLEAALAYYDLIPEHVAAVTSVTIKRPGHWENPLGDFFHRHIQPAYFFGFQRLQVDFQQYAYVALPEKALLDLIYLHPDGDTPAYLESLRLQNLDKLNIDRLESLAAESNQLKLQHAARFITDLALEEAASYELL